MRCRKGETLRSLLTHFWKEQADQRCWSRAEINEIFSLIQKSGLGGLTWHIVRQYDDCNSTEYRQFQQAYRLYSIQAAVNNLNLGRLSDILAERDVHFLLGKGWAIAQHYPQPGLRPYTDFDIYLDPAQLSTAKETLRNNAHDLNMSVDMHSDLRELNDRSFNEVMRRSKLVRVEDSFVRVFCKEDHLRLISLHMLRHGAWRPLWLCDVAVAFESRGGDFDWDYFLSGNERRTEWVIASIGLAHRLLGARVEGTPIENSAKVLPSWLIDTVLSQWGKESYPHGARLSMKYYLRHPAGIAEALKIRWPNAIEATVGMRGPFNDFPRLPYQIGECVRRIVSFIPKIPGHLRDRNSMDLTESN